MDIASLDSENPYEDTIDVGNNSLFSEIQDDEESGLDTDDEIDLKLLSNNLKIDIIKADGTVVSGPIINPKPDIISTTESLQIPDTLSGNIVNTPEADPSISGIPEFYVVQKRIIGTKHSENRGKPHHLYINKVQKIDRNELIMRLNDFNTEETRYGKYVVAPSRKIYKKEQIKALSDAKQLQKDLQFEAEPTYDDEIEEYLEQNPETREGLNEGRKIKLNKVESIGTRSSRMKTTKYKELTIQNSIVLPTIVQEDLPYNLPKYEPLTLENGLMQEYNESEIEFKFRVIWTQIALQIGAGNISVATAISLGKMEIQKIKYGVTFDVEMEKLIETVNNVYTLNSEILEI